MRTTKQRPPAKIDLSDFLSTDRWPHSAQIPLGDGRTLGVRYRAADIERNRAAVMGAIGPELEALGLDPETALNAAAGQLPQGDARAALKAGMDALDEDGQKRFEAAVALADGISLADVIGEWDFAQEISPESCHALPGDLKRTLVQLAQSAVLPVDQLDFSPASLSK